MVTGQSGDYVAPGTMSASGGHVIRTSGFQTGTTPLGNAPMPGVDHAVDQVQRAQRVMKANPGLFISTPSQNGTNHYAADFAVGDAGSGCIHHEKLRDLLDELAAKHGFTE